MSVQGRIPRKSRPKPLSNSQVGLFKWPDTEAFQMQTDVGTLGVLPLEILQHILQQLDIASLTCLDCVSKGMKRAVGSLPKLRALFGNQNLFIQAIWAARAGEFITCSELYDRLCDPKCRLCDDPGTHIYLLACHRLYYSCLTKTERHRTMRPREASRHFNLPLAALRDLPQLRVPKYGSRPQGDNRFYMNLTGWTLIDKGALLHASVRRKVEAGECEEEEAVTMAEQMLEDMETALCSEASPNLHTPCVEHALCASVELRWLDRSTQAVHFAILCEACHSARAPTR